MPDWLGLSTILLVALALHFGSNSKGATAQQRDRVRQPVGGMSNFTTLVFEEEFDRLDTSVWEHLITAGGGGNWEFQYYTNNRTNSYVRDGKLHLKATLTSERFDLYRDNLELWGNTPPSLCTGNQFYGCMRIGGAGGNPLNPLQSAAIRTSRSFNFKYGRVEVRAKLPRGDWLWPAIWFLPRWNQYGDWPSSGEIDLMESRGNSRGYPNGVKSISSTLHWGLSWDQNAWPLTTSTFTLTDGSDFSDDFHVFGLEWNEKGLFTYVDSRDNVVLNIPFDRPFIQRGGWQGSTRTNPWVAADNKNAAPFDQDFYLIINLAVGGVAYFQDGVGNKPWSNKDQTSSKKFWEARTQWLPTWDRPTLEVDYVRIWQ